MFKIPTTPPSHGGHWLQVSVFALLSVYLYVFTEWLFFVTKPSFMSVLGWLEKLAVLISSPLPLAVAVTAVLSALWVPTRLLQNEATREALLRLARAVPSFAMMVTAFLLVDNFTYIVLGFSSQTATFYFKGLYVLLSGALFAILYQTITSAGKVVGNKWKFLKVLTGVLLAMSIVFHMTSWTPQTLQEPSPTQPAAQSSRPNVILIGSDGLDAVDMRLYSTTGQSMPFLESLASESLVLENAFVNSAHTGSSLASILTGRLPTANRLIYPPDILRGVDAYRHLPAILKGLGYRNVEISVRYYADATDLNLRNSFDQANSRKIASQSSWLSAVGSSQDVVYFLDTLTSRVTDRFGYLFGLVRADDAFEQVTRSRSKRLRDSERIADLEAFVDAGSGPFFAHLHLLGTHGNRYGPKALRAFDHHLETLWRFLRLRGMHDQTIFIVYTDHGQGYTTNVRVPLIFRFPRGSFAGHQRFNTQTLDIAPTILDYLDRRIPSWMMGKSLISTELEKLRPVFSTRVKARSTFNDGKGRKVDMRRIGPPFFTLGTVTMIVCHQVYTLELNTNRFQVETITDHTDPCDLSHLPTESTARDLIVNLLKKHRYDVSSLTSVKEKRQ